LGSLRVGGIADITIIDPNLTWTIDVNTFASTGRNCPFDGWNVKGKAIATIYSGILSHQTLRDRAQRCN
jgi:dihydroorotase